MFRPRTPALGILLLALSTVSLLAQASGGRIVGIVRDATGVPVVGATITATNEDTRVTRVVRTSAIGAYEVAGLPAGRYTVAATMSGFREVTQRGLQLATDGRVVADFTFEVRVAEEITVTAMKREETIRNTPFSVTAPTEADLRERGVDNIEEVAANVPSFSVQNLGPGQSQVSIRGVSSGQLARDQPGVKENVGSYLDESVISLSLFTPDIDLFDVNRVEVLRGPQGTLFGSGSEGGTVRYITNLPEMGVSRYFGEFNANLIDSGNAGGSAKVGFNAPLTDKVAMRLAGYYDRFAGWMDAVQPNTNLAGGFTIKDNVNTGDRTGIRAAVTFQPDENLMITPRIFYQTLKMDGWNRIDIFNILANPYTTTRPKVTLGERQLFTQIDEPTTDKFVLGDLNVHYNFGDVLLTSVTSYTHRDILVVRDATALTASITGGSIGLAEKVYTLNAPLDDATSAWSITEEMRLSGGKDRFKWVGGIFYGHTHRAYGQSLPVTGFQAATGIPTQGLRAPKDVLFFSDLSYGLDQFALFGEGTYTFSPRFSFTGGLRYYHYKEDKEQVFDGIFAQDNTGTQIVSQPGTVKADGVAPRFILSWKATDDTNVNFQASKGFRLGGVNDPLNVPLCTPQDLATFSGKDTWKDETAWNYELGSKSTIFNGRGSLNASAFYVDISDLQVTVTAGSCSSRLIFNVPKARSVGGELEFATAITNNIDFDISASYTDAKLRSTVRDGAGNIVSGIEEGKKLPSVPWIQGAATLTYQYPISPGFLGYVTSNFQHVGPRFTQVGDDLLGTLDLNSFGKNTIGGPLTQSTFHYSAELPAYDILNMRFGVRHGSFDAALYVNNLTDERAFLALDRERGTRARIGYLTNQPRTFGLSSRVDF
ncbi:MAG TPA: TonB-dependent receptor [Thermoanaerobaculia bacterium]|nr:TonB-dependent receptor [Thermoanaerobaculia bacterium]